MLNFQIIYTKNLTEKYNFVYVQDAQQMTEDIIKEETPGMFLVVLELFVQKF